MKVVSVPHSKLKLIEKAAGEEYADTVEMVKSGKAEFFMLGRCYFVTWADHRKQGKELVVGCAEGKGIKAATRELYRLAKLKGFHSVRFHTSRKGLSRLLSEMPFREVETIYRMEL